MGVALPRIRWRVSVYRQSPYHYGPTVPMRWAVLKSLIGWLRRLENDPPWQSGCMCKTESRSYHGLRCRSQNSLHICRVDCRPGLDIYLLDSSLERLGIMQSLVITRLTDLV